MKFLKTMEDVDVLLEIGYRQEGGGRFSVKELHHAGIATPGTLQRRLRRLREAGVLVERRAQADGRSIELELAPQVLALYGKYAELLGLA